MSLLVAVLILLLLAVVMLVLSAPLRSARRRPDPRSAELDELQAAREAKYREIRDTELDYRTGKLSAEDYAAVDATLRAQALDILDRLSALEGEPTPDEVAPGEAVSEEVAPGETASNQAAPGEAISDEFAPVEAGTDELGPDDDEAGPTETTSPDARTRDA